MKRRILVISKEEPLVSKLQNSLSRLRECQVISEPDGESAYRRLKELQPAAMIVDLETPNLVLSWLAMHLDTDGPLPDIPAVMISGVLEREEREIVSDLTGYPVMPKNSGVNCLEMCML